MNNKHPLEVFLDSLPEPKTRRHRFEHGDAKISFDVPLDISDEELKAAEDQAKNLAGRGAAFRSLPETVRLKHYLALLVKAAREARDSRTINVKDWVANREEVERQRANQMAEALSRLDFALLQVPTEYKSEDNILEI